MPKRKVLTAERIAEIKSRGIDLSDIPEITDFSGFHLRNIKLEKKAITIRLDMDNLEWLKKDGRGYQKRLNAALRWARLHGCPLTT